MSKLKKAWEYIRQHKYLITILVFLLIIGVLDEENSLIQRFSHWREIQTLNTEIRAGSVWFSCRFAFAFANGTACA